MRLRFLFFIWMLIVSPSLASSQQSEIHHDCGVVEELQIRCNIRFASPWFAPGSPEKVELVWPDGNREEISFKAYNPNEDTTAWLLLFDRSRSLEKDSIKVIREDFSKIISGLRSKEKVGISSFAENFRLIAPIGVERSQLKLALEQIQAIGNETFLYQSALEALEVIGQFEAKRRALVIISDGRSEDHPDVNFQSVIKRANELDIVIYAIGYSEKPENDIYLDEFQELAKQTKGPSQRAQLYNDQGRVLSPRLMQYFLDFMQNGGTATFENRMNEQEVTVKIVATLDDGRQLTSEIKLDPIFVEKKEPEPVPVVIPEKKTGLFGIPIEYELAVLSMMAGLLLLILLGFFIWILKRSSKTEEPISDIVVEGSDHDTAIDTTNASEVEGTQLIEDDVPDVVYGILEQVDPVAARIELKKTTLSIGRHNDNDIQFSSSTVSRRHASLHMNADKDFVITDLSGSESNGTSVNQVRIETHILETGDLIELGDIRLRYIRANE